MAKAPDKPVAKVSSINSKKKKTSFDETPDGHWLGAKETANKKVFETIIAWLTVHKASYLHLGDDSLCVIVDGERITINLELANVALNRMLVKACDGPQTREIQSAIQRLQVYVYDMAGEACLSKFAARRKDSIYLPKSDGNILCIGPEFITTEPNGHDDIWLEHPYEHIQALRYNADKKQIIPSLEMFERLCIETQACAIPEMKYLVGMNAGIFPYSKEYTINRFIEVHFGPSQQGKTSGLQRFTKLHGLGDVKGDITVAAANNLGDVGIIVFDNKEHVNLDTKTIEYLLHSATGGQRARTGMNGKVRESGPRPVAFMTCIEGTTFKQELSNRSVSIEYRTSGPILGRLEIEDEITDNRHSMLSAFVPVIQAFLNIRKEHRPTPEAVPEFREHFVALADMLRAYAQVLKRPVEWAEDLITKWASTITDQETVSHKWEFPIIEAIRKAQQSDMIRQHPVMLEGEKGILYITYAAELHRIVAASRSIPDLPEDSGGFGKRLRSDKFEYITPIFDSHPELSKFFPSRKKGRPLGIFVPDE